MPSFRDFLQPAGAFVVAAALGLSVGKMADRRVDDAAEADAPKARVEPPPLSVGKKTWFEALATSAPRDLSAFYQAAALERDQQDLVAHYWARTDPESMLCHLLGADPPNFSDRSHAKHLLMQWAEQDFAAAIEAGLAIPAFNPDRHEFLKEMLVVGMNRDPQGTFSAVTTAMGESGASVWPSTDVEALKLLSTLPMLGTYGLSLNAGVRSWADEEPEAAVAWAREYCEDKRYGDREAYTSALTTWAGAEEGATQAVDLLRELPPRSRWRSLRFLTDTLARQNMDETVSLIENDLQGASRVDIATQAASALTDDDPMLGVQFATSFEDPDVRQQAIDEVVEGFRSADRERFETWVGGISEPGLREEVALSVGELERRQAAREE